jgi:hypothetical protein
MPVSIIGSLLLASWARATMEGKKRQDGGLPKERRTRRETKERTHTAYLVSIKGSLAATTSTVESSTLRFCYELVTRLERSKKGSLSGNLRIPEDLEARQWEGKSSKEEGRGERSTYDSANATEAVDSDL